MRLEINKELVLSTAHISENTNYYLNSDCSDFIDYSSDSCNYRLLVENILIDMNREGDNFNELYNLAQLAKENGCKWLLLDRDGLMVDNLETFEW